MRIARAGKGCVVTYGDHDGHEGHMAVATQPPAQWPVDGDGRGLREAVAATRIVDASLSSARGYGDGIRKHSASAFYRPGVFMGFVP